MPSTSAKKDVMLTINLIVNDRQKPSFLKLKEWCSPGTRSCGIISMYHVMFSSLTNCTAIQNRVSPFLKLQSCLAHYLWQWSMTVDAKQLTILLSMPLRCLMEAKQGWMHYTVYLQKIFVFTIRKWTASIGTWRVGCDSLAIIKIR